MRFNQYDAIIIGAGIGGLVCGCCLAKSGKKVLIIEKNKKPGGYCTSFKIKDFCFDAFVHSFGNASKGNHFYQILKSLNILKRLKFVRHNPSDIIYAPDFVIKFWNDHFRVINDLSKIFPTEKESIRNFFIKVINEEGLGSVSRFRNKTFLEVLDQKIKNDKLKAALSLPIFGNLGLTAKRISAFTAIKHYKQFILDGGYYPEGGVQAVPDVFLQKFKELGGQMLFSTKVFTILTTKQKACGVTTHNGGKYYSKYIVSDCDAKSTFLNFIGEKKLPRGFVKKIKLMKSSSSLAIVQLGVESNLKHHLENNVNNWFMFDYNYDKVDSKSSENNFLNIKWFMIRPNFSQRSIVIYTTAPFRSERYWRKNREIYLKEIISRIEHIIPACRKSISFQNILTPIVLRKWTENYRGAAYGWASSPDQLMDGDFISDNIVKNLFLCGHWSTVGQGIPGVSIAGERVARNILRRESRSYAKK